MHLLVLAQNNVITPRSGGALRVACLFREFIETGHEVTVIRYRKAGEGPSDLSTGVSVYDIIVPPAYDLAPVAALTHLVSRKALRIARQVNARRSIDLVQSDPPWASLTGERIARALGVPHLVLSQNCETVLAAQFSRNGHARRVPLVGGLLADFNVSVVRWAEKRAVERAQLTLTPSEHDVAEMESVGIKPRKVGILPNGTNVKRLAKEQRMDMKEQLGLGAERPTVIFVGRMDYMPNRDAIDAICLTIAPACPGVTFILVGSNPPRIETPPNVKMIGFVERVDEYLGAADLSIVPLTRGSGTRIKILDGWAAGLPVLSTSIGASGLDYKEGENIAIEDNIEEFPSRVMELLGSPEKLERLGKGAVDASIPYQWKTLARQYTEALCALAERG